METPSLPPHFLPPDTVWEFPGSFLSRGVGKERGAYSPVVAKAQGRQGWPVTADGIYPDQVNPNQGRFFPFKFQKISIAVIYSTTSEKVENPCYPHLCFCFAFSLFFLEWWQKMVSNRRKWKETLVKCPINREHLKQPPWTHDAICRWCIMKLI